MVVINSEATAQSHGAAGLPAVATVASASVPPPTAAATSPRDAESGTASVAPLLGVRPGQHTRAAYSNLEGLGQGERTRFVGPYPKVFTQPGEVERDEGWEVVTPIASDEGAKTRDRAGVGAAVGATSGAVTFTLNGATHTVDPSLDPRTTLAEYLRYTVGLTGTKIGCGEGGCGACTVGIQAPDGGYLVVNACLRPVLACAGQTIVTVEGLKTSPTTYDPVQTALAKGCGTQCGYCSPGMVMSMWTLLQNNKQPTADEVEQRFAGNICRCTGYAPILQSFRGMADDMAAASPDAATDLVEGADGGEWVAVDVESEGGQQTEVEAESVGPLVAREANGVNWIKASTLKDVFAALSHTAPGDVVRLAVGNTSAGVAKYYDPVPADTPNFFVDVSTVPDLTVVLPGVPEDGVIGVRVGAAVTLSNLIAALEKIGAVRPTQIAAHLSKVAHWQVRDQASWAGNVVMAKHHPNFPSDVVLCLVAAEATLTLQSPTGASTIVTAAAFMANPLAPNTVVVSAHIPYVGAGVEYFDTEKIMQRHINTHALVNAGCRLSLSADATPTIEGALICFGNIVPGGPLLCVKTADALVGKPLTMATYTAALAAFKAEVVCAPPTGTTDPNFVVVDPAYRTALAENLFYKFFLRAMVQVGGATAVDPKVLSAATPYHRPLSSSKQTYPSAGSYAPVGAAVEKIEAVAQCAGEVQYTSDLALPTGTLFAVPVLATQPGTSVESIDASQALALPGVAAFVSAKDVADIGASNRIAKSGYEVFVGADKVAYYGQFLGLLCASSFSLAARAAALVSVKYSARDPEFTLRVEPGVAAAPVLQGAAATAERLMHDTQGDDAAGVGKTLTASGHQVTHGQKHFYMETQTTLAVPGAEKRLTVHSACQCLSTMRAELALTLVKLESSITCDNTRIGGAYGGKAFLYLPVAAAACVAALKLDKPVLLQLDRNTDMTSLGGRSPATAALSVAVDGSGKLTELGVTATVDSGNGGLAVGCTSLNAYDVKGAKLKSEGTNTDTANNTIMRAPGDFQGAFFMEAAIELAATTAGLPPMQVQEANLLSGVQGVWTQLKTVAGVEAKQAAVETFNAANTYRKQGLYCQPVMYQMNTAQFNQMAEVTIHPDGSISINHSGIEVGQGINTKVEQAVAYALSKPGPTVTVDLMATVVPKSTQVFPDASPTWSSGTSESVVYAALKACDTLNTALQPYQSPGSTWVDVVKKAAAGGAKLTASGSRPIGEGGAYPLPCAACVVVELDTLTGENQILSVDIVYDCGESLNPAIDVGQIQGSFVQASGMMLTEGFVRSKVDGRLVNNGTWDYKPPSALDIPIDFNVTLLSGSDNTEKAAVLGSKASGEPAVLLGVGTFFALKQAVAAARKDAGLTGWFELSAPATPDVAQLACGAKPLQ